jgi:predicted HicB family RNase H-like nuclease
MNVLKYKGYAGVVEFDAEERMFFGRVVGLWDVLSFQGRSVKDLERDFQQTIDEYLDFCARMGKKPDKPFSGKFVVRLNPELHRQAVIAANAKARASTPG